MSHFKALHCQKRIAVVFITAVALIGLVSCAPVEQDTGQADYQQTKQIVLDIIQTEDGKKAIQEVLAEEEMQKNMLLETDLVEQAIQETLLSEENGARMKQMMMDPEFSVQYAQSMESEHKKLLKDLMHDPDYRGTMIEVLREPEMEEHFLEIAKSNRFRQETMNVMKEAMENPYFKLEIMRLLQESALEIQDEQAQQDEDDQQGGGGNGGGDGDEGS